MDPLVTTPCLALSELSLDGVKLVISIHRSVFLILQQFLGPDLPLVDSVRTHFGFPDFQRLSEKGFGFGGIWRPNTSPLGSQAEWLAWILDADYAQVETDDSYAGLASLAILVAALRRVECSDHLLGCTLASETGAFRQLVRIENLVVECPGRIGEGCSLIVTLMPPLIDWLKSKPDHLHELSRTFRHLRRQIEPGASPSTFAETQVTTGVQGFLAINLDSRAGLVQKRPARPGEEVEFISHNLQSPCRIYMILMLLAQLSQTARLEGVR